MVLEFNVFMCDESLIQPTRVMKLWFLLTIEMYAESTALEQFNMILITFAYSGNCKHCFVDNQINFDIIPSYILYNL